MVQVRKVVANGVVFLTFGALAFGAEAASSQDDLAEIYVVPVTLEKNIRDGEVGIKFLFS